MGPQLPHECQTRLADGTGAEARLETASTVALTVFRRRLALGAARWRLVLVTRAAVPPAEPVTAPDGRRLPSHDQRPTTDGAVVGHVGCARHAVTARGQEGRCPRDAELRVPAPGSSDLRREWAVYGTPDESCRARHPGRARIVGVSLSLQARAPAVAEAGPEVTTCEAPPAAPTTPPPGGTRWGVPADGPGGPMVPPPPQTSPDRLEPAARPRPAGKARRATGAGQGVAMRRLRPRGAPREGPHSQPRGARTDGAEARPPAGAEPRSGAPRGARSPPGPRVAVGHGQPPAGGNPSAAPGLGARGPGAAAGGADRPHHHGVGGRGAGPDRHEDATAGGAADGRRLASEPTRSAF